MYVYTQVSSSGPGDVCESLTIEYRIVKTSNGRNHCLTVNRNKIRVTRGRLNGNRSGKVQSGGYDY